MRLSAEQADAIKAAALDAFGPSAIVRLFGSRTHEDARGGDIDLHVEAAPEVADLVHEARFRSLLWQRLDEEHVDVAVLARGAEPGWLDRAALREGVIL